jgi:hypothetical protein
MTDTELKNVLESLELSGIVVRVEGTPGHLVAAVTTPDFARKDDAARQAIVWNHLLNKLTPAQCTEVEIVVTLAPDEADGEADDT